MFKPGTGRMILYAGIAMAAYVLSLELGTFPVFASALVLVAFLIVADLGGKTPGRFLRVFGISLSSALILPENWSSLWEAFLGTGLVLLAPSLKNRAKLVRGLGLLMLLHGVSGLPPVGGYSRVFLYTGISLFVAYALSELGIRFFEENALGFGILGGLFGLYASMGGTLLETHPELVFYAEWLILFLGVLIAGNIVYSLVSRTDPEEYLLRLWEEGRPFDPELKAIERAVQEFVIRGRRGPLVAFLAYYGGRLFGTRAEFEELVSRVADYEPEKTSPLTPAWIRRRRERAELARRMRIVEEVLDELEKLLGRGGER